MFVFSLQWFIKPRKSVSITNSMLFQTYVGKERWLLTICIYSMAFTIIFSQFQGVDIEFLFFDLILGLLTRLTEIVYPTTTELFYLSFMISLNGRVRRQWCRFYNYHSNISSSVVFPVSVFCQHGLFVIATECFKQLYL